MFKSFMTLSTMDATSPPLMFFTSFSSALSSSSSGSSSPVPDNPKQSAIASASIFSVAGFILRYLVLIAFTISSMFLISLSFKAVTIPSAIFSCMSDLYIVFFNASRSFFFISSGLQFSSSGSGSGGGGRGTGCGGTGGGSGVGPASSPFSIASMSSNKSFRY